MSFDSTLALREAGLIGGALSPELEEFYAGLTQDETNVLIKTKERLAQVLPDVTAHSADWSTPESSEQDFDASMLCGCGIWSGSGDAN